MIKGCIIFLTIFCLLIFLHWCSYGIILHDWRPGFLYNVVVAWSRVGFILGFFIFETCVSGMLPCTILANVLTILTLGTRSGIVIGETIFVPGLSRTNGLPFDFKFALQRYTQSVLYIYLWYLMTKQIDWLFLFSINFLQ